MSEQVTYETSKVFMLEGWYTISELRDTIEELNRINELNRKAMEPIDE
jgi:hypothetical protein